MVSTQHTAVHAEASNLCNGFGVFLTFASIANMHMGGMGTAMMKHVMKQKNVDSLPEMLALAQAGGVKLVACSMSMDVMGIKREELIDGIEVGGVASFLGESDDATMTLFI